MYHTNWFSFVAETCECGRFAGGGRSPNSITLSRESCESVDNMYLGACKEVMWSDSVLNVTSVSEEITASSWIHKPFEGHYE